MKFFTNLFNSIGTWQGIVSIVLVIIVSVLVFILGKNKGKGLATRDVVAIGIGAALYGALSFAEIPVATNTSLRVSVALLVILGSIFGPVVGFLAGFIGHALHDALAYGSIWWSWVFLSGVIGLFAGFVTFDKEFNVLAGKVSKKHIFQLYLYSVISIIVGSIIAYAGDVFLYGEPATKVNIQLIAASAVNFAVIAIIGIPAIIALAKTRNKNSNLDIEE